MKHFINKAALVAEIEKRKIPFQRDVEDGIYPTYLCALMDFEDFINTIETKEVDLMKEYLTWKDIRELYIIFAKIDAEIEFGKTDIQRETIGYYQEALKQLKVQKGE